MLTTLGFIGSSIRILRWLCRTLGIKVRVPIGGVGVAVPPLVVISAMGGIL